MNWKREHSFVKVSCFGCEYLYNFYATVIFLSIIQNFSAGIRKLKLETFLCVRRILDGNKISEIQHGHLTGLDKLETLKLDQNEIAIADFSDLENSTAIYLM